MNLREMELYVALEAKTLPLEEMPHSLQMEPREVGFTGGGTRDYLPGYGMVNEVGI